MTFLSSRAPLSAALVAAGLVGGFAVAQRTGNRQLGGAVFAAAGMTAFPRCLNRSGPLGASAVAATYVTAMGVSHPLARKVGSWPSVGLVTAAATASAYLIADRTSVPRAVDAPARAGCVGLLRETPRA